MSGKASNHELRFTETNSADDSPGKTWGLEGNLFWFVAGGTASAGPRKLSGLKAAHEKARSQWLT